MRCLGRLRGPRDRDGPLELSRQARAHLSGGSVAVVGVWSLLGWALQTLCWFQEVYALDGASTTNYYEDPIHSTFVWGD